MNGLFTLIISAALFIALQAHSFAGVNVFDEITPVKKPIMLSAITKGRFFSEGGKLVQFYIDEKHIGTTLSGGDGYAYLKYTPAAPGLFKITAASGGVSSDARLLVTKKNGKVVFIAMEKSLLESFLFSPDKKDSGKELIPLSKDFHLVYLANMLGLKQTGAWLRERGFPDSIVLRWEGAVLMRSLQDKGISLYAIVATPEILSEARGIKRRYSFQESEYGETVKDWQDLINKLKK